MCLGQCFQLVSLRRERALGPLLLLSWPWWRLCTAALLLLCLCTQGLLLLLPQPPVYTLRLLLPCKPLLLWCV
jgi:hypothetical protein